jgi:hypothetical protein
LANKANDTIFAGLQKLVFKFDQIARDVVFLPQVQFDNGVITSMSLIQRHILTRQKLEAFQVPYSVSLLITYC